MNLHIFVLEKDELILGYKATGFYWKMCGFFRTFKFPSEIVSISSFDLLLLNSKKSLPTLS